jgi:WD40 repeat protein
VRCNGAVGEIGTKRPEHSRDCWALAAYDEGNVLAGGYENGDVKIFDLRQRRVFWESNLSCGVQDVQFGGSKLTMFVGLTDGSLQAFGCFNDSMNPMKISGQQSSSRGKCVWGMDTHRQQDMIVVYNGDGELQLWEFSPKSPEMNLRKRSELLVSFEESGSVFDFRRSSHDSTIGIGISLDNLLYRFKMI